jgi:hypothetical protein
MILRPLLLCLEFKLNRAGDVGVWEGAGDIDILRLPLDSSDASFQVDEEDVAPLDGVKRADG